MLEKKHKLIHAWQSLALIIYGLHLILVSSSLDNNGSFARLEQFGFLWRFSSFPNILSVPFLHISQWKIYGVDMIDLTELSWLKRILGSWNKKSNWAVLGYKSLDALIVQIRSYLNLNLNSTVNHKNFRLSDPNGKTVWGIKSFYFKVKDPPLKSISSNRCHFRVKIHKNTESRKI